jgi:nicotinamidase-related amidase
MALIDRDNCTLFVIDVQERLLPAVQSPEQTLANTLALVEVARQLEVPIAYSEQYPQGLGATEESLLSLLEGNAERFEKQSFSCVSEPQIKTALNQWERKQIIIAGMETHVCVLQTVLELCEMGFQVFVVEDAVSSRKADDKAVALQRMLHNQVTLVSKEMVMFEWLKRADHPKFKEISRQFIR